jgi:hypothetical protein
MNERDWDAFRRGARRRSAAVMGLILGPIILLGAAVKVVEPHDYPAGDPRNEPLFWMMFAVVALVLVGSLLVGSIRELRKREPSDRLDQ